MRISRHAQQLLGVVFIFDFPPAKHCSDHPQTFAMRKPPLIESEALLHVAQKCSAAM